MQLQAHGKVPPQIAVKVWMLLYVSLELKRLLGYYLFFSTAWQPWLHSTKQLLVLWFDDTFTVNIKATKYRVGLFILSLLP